MKIGLAAVLVAGMAAAAGAQMSGVSHPEEVQIVTGADGVPQPVIYQGAPAAAEAKPVLSASVAAPRTGEEGKLVSRPDPDAGIVTRVEGPSNQLPVGTLVKVRMKESLSTKSTALGTVFTAELSEPVLRDGRVLLPAGSTLTGKVTEVHGGRRISGRASMHLMTEHVTLPDGTVYALHGQVIDTEMYKKMKVDSEGTIVHGGSRAGSAATFGLATGSGAASGALLGGWPGAIIGAGVGAGITTVVWLKQDRQTELPAGTGVTFMLTAPVKVGVE